MIASVPSVFDGSARAELMDAAAGARAAVGQRQPGDGDVGPGPDRQDAALALGVDGQHVGAGPSIVMAVGDGREGAEAQVDGTLQERREDDRVAAAGVGVGEGDRVAERRTVPVRTGRSLPSSSSASVVTTMVVGPLSKAPMSTALALDARRSSLVGGESRGESASRRPRRWPGCRRAAPWSGSTRRCSRAARAWDRTPTWLPLTPSTRPPAVVAPSIRLLVAGDRAHRRCRWRRRDRCCPRRSCH